MRVLPLATHPVATNAPTLSKVYEHSLQMVRRQLSLIIRGQRCLAAAPLPFFTKLSIVFTVLALRGVREAV